MLEKARGMISNVISLVSNLLSILEKKDAEALALLQNTHEKTISLLRIDPIALNQLKQKGECIFELSEALYDRDFPGHYCRQITNLAVSIPSLIGPYQNIKATLIQQSNKVLIKDDKDALDYMFGTSQEATDSVWNDLQAQQTIIISRGTEDTGILNFNGNDERYLPFEGTGAVSSWKLEMPKAANQFDYASITDVVIKVQYTAKISTDSSFTSAVTKRDEVEEYSTHNALALAQYAPTQWKQFKQDPTLSLIIQPSNLTPANVSKPEITQMTLSVEAPSDTSASYSFQLKNNGTLFERLQHGAEPPESKPVSLDLPPDPWEFVLTKGQENIDALENLIVMVEIQGKLEW